MSSLTPSKNVERLIKYARLHLHLDEANCIYVRNKLLFALNLDYPETEFEPDESEIAKMKSPSDIVNPLLDYAVKSKIIKNDDKLQFETFLIDCVCPSPAEVISLFDRAITREKDVAAGCRMLYDFGFKSNYIRYDDVTSNVKWIAKCDKTDLEITINTAKPEKSNKDIAAARRAAPEKKYPLCVLCKENVGFTGKPYRHTLRTIPLDLMDESERWYMQYSPYNYYPEHCIVFSEDHTPMCVTHDTIKKLFDFVEIFPHYFLGSNASLPIIGGSILSHEHYQGGSHEMPVHKTKTRFRFTSPNHPTVRITIPDWYNSTIRIESRSRAHVEEITNLIMDGWDIYNNESLNIIAKTDEQHSGITPIARFNKDGEYTVDIILRNNRADNTHPEGIFHVSPDLFNIKKEGIGLIEAMGVFILPGRLAAEAEGIKDYLTGAKTLDLKALADESNPLNKHMGFIVQLVNDNGTNLSDEDAGMKIEQAINKACERILKCTAVFKEDKSGQKAFVGFMTSLGFIKS